MANKTLELVILAVALVLLVLLLLSGNYVALLVSAVIAVVLLYLLNMFFKLGIPINWISIVVVVAGGLLGLILVIILNRLKIAFC